MKHVVVGTAGHVDHGKTSLVKAVTGIDTDRLKEEKERGITIELGFASLALSDGRTVGVVDVPGHERFIKNMVAGAAGIDLVVLVIAADEGVMPQTREHLDICSLLGIRRGIVALTKIDMVDRDWLDLVADDISGFLRGTFLEGAPILPVSALTGEGLPAFLLALEAAVSAIEAEGDSEVFRLPIDRVFTIRGFGTVVTGTLLAGRIAVGEDIAILPTDRRAKIRGIQIHNQAAGEAVSGQRTAINLQGVDKGDIERGQVIARPGTLEATRRLDVVCDYLPGQERRLKNRSLVRFHMGTAEIMARITLMDLDEMAPGSRGSAQIFLESPTAAMAGDRFVIRSYSPITTIGGGLIVDPLPKKHKRLHPQVRREFDQLRDGDPGDKLAVIIERAGFAGVNLTQLVMRTGLQESRVRRLLERMFSERRAVLLDKDEPRIVALPVYEALQQRMLEALRAYHERFPLKEGAPREELRTTLGAYLAPKLFHMAMRDLEKGGLVAVDRENIRLPGHRVDLQGDLEVLRNQIAAAYQEAGYAPPTVREILERFAQQKQQVASIFKVMLQEGLLIKINEELYFHRDLLQRLREDYRSLLLREGRANPTSFRELTGLTRKFIIPLMEYFDMAKLTIRVGDHRILRERETK